MGGAVVAEAGMQILVYAVHPGTDGMVLEVRIVWDGPDPVANDPAY